MIYFKLDPPSASAASFVDSPLVILHGSPLPGQILCLPLGFLINQPLCFLVIFFLFICDLLFFRPYMPLCPPPPPVFQSKRSHSSQKLLRCGGSLLSSSGVPAGAAIVSVAAAELSECLSVCGLKLSKLTQQMVCHRGVAVCGNCSEKGQAPLKSVWQVIERAICPSLHICLNKLDRLNGNSWYNQILLKPAGTKVKHYSPVKSSGPSLNN